MFEFVCMSAKGAQKQTQYNKVRLPSAILYSEHVHETRQCELHSAKENMRFVYI